jgi:hypothetical protein
LPLTQRSRKSDEGGGKLPMEPNLHNNIPSGPQWRVVVKVGKRSGDFFEFMVPTTGPFTHLAVLFWMKVPNGAIPRLPATKIDLELAAEYHAALGRALKAARK